LRVMLYIALALVVAIALSGMSLVILAIELVGEEEEHPPGALTRYRARGEKVLKAAGHYHQGSLSSTGAFAER
jgi:hypothetical protein